MSTVEETVSENATTVDYEAAYKQSVFDGNLDGEILFQARRTQSEWNADRQVYESRVAAREKLNTIPDLERAAAEAQAKADTASDFISYIKSVLPDSETLGDIRTRLRAFIPDAKVDTIADLYDLLQRVGSIAADLRLKAHQASQLPRETADAARRELYSTADPLALASVKPMQGRTGVLASSIAQRDAIFAAEREIARQQQLCRDLAAGKVLPTTYCMGQAVNQSPEERYRLELKKLDELTSLAAGADAARKANERDQAEIARLSAEIQGRLDPLIFDPKRTKWCD
jgi:uncharacterized small protein (DUF1192 family)